MAFLSITATKQIFKKTYFFNPSLTRLLQNQNIVSLYATHKNFVFKTMIKLDDALAICNYFYSVKGSLKNTNDK